MHLKSTAGCQISTLIYEKEPGNTFNLSPKWARTLPSLTYFYGIFIETPFHNVFSNIKVDIWHPPVGLRCIWLKLQVGKNYAVRNNLFMGYIYTDPTTGCQISTLRRGLYKYHMKNILPLTFLAWYTLGNDTPNTQIYDLSLSWLGTGLVAIPLKHKNILPLRGNIFLCFKGIATKPVLNQESERSYICVLGVSLPSLYQARKVRGHIFVC
jgi:hypothetical protein